MKIEFSFLQQNQLLEIPEAVFKEYEFDKIIISNKDMTFEISGIAESHAEKSYPSTILESLIIGVKDGKREVLGYFPKILIFQRMIEKKTEIVSVCGRYMEEDILNYYESNKKILDELKDIDVQFISANDALIEFEKIYLDTGLELFKKEKNVKQRN